MATHSWWLFRRDHVAEIFPVLVAVHLEDVVVRHEIVIDLYGDRPDVILRIVPGDLGFKMAEVPAMIALGHVHVFASGMAHAVDRSVIVEAARFYYEGVAFPPSDRVTEARGEVKLRGELAAVGEDLTVLVVDLVNDHRLPRCLNDLERLGKQGKHGPALAV